MVRAKRVGALSIEICCHLPLTNIAGTFSIHEIGRIDGGRGFRTGKNVFRIGKNTFYDRKNKILLKIPEFKRSGIGLIAEFRGIPNGFLPSWSLFFVLVPTIGVLIGIVGILNIVGNVTFLDVLVIVGILDIFVVVALLDVLVVVGILNFVGNVALLNVLVIIGVLNVLVVGIGALDDVIAVLIVAIILVFVVILVVVVMPSSR
jgi:hypothetical protein